MIEGMDGFRKIIDARRRYEKEFGEEVPSLNGSSFSADEIEHAILTGVKLNPDDREAYDDENGAEPIFER